MSGARPLTEAEMEMALGIVQAPPPSAAPPPRIVALVVHLCPRYEAHPLQAQARRRGRDAAWWCDTCKLVVDPIVRRVFLAEEVARLMQAGLGGYLVQAEAALRERDAKVEPHDLVLEG